MNRSAITRLFHAFAFPAIFSLPAFADEFGDEAFDLRFGAALSRLSTYPNVIGRGGAGAASLTYTSPNPAALNWRRALPPRYLTEYVENTAVGISGQVIDVRFQNDTDLFITAQSINWYVSPLTAIRFSFAQVRSNEEVMRGSGGGNIFEFDLNAYRFEWSRRFVKNGTGRLAIGFMLGYVQSETNVSNVTGPRVLSDNRNRSAPRRYRSHLSA